MTSPKTFHILKIKKYFTKSSFFFFFNSTDSNIKTLTKQSFKKLKLDYYKILNKTTNKLLKNSIYTINISPLISGITFIVKPIKKITKNILLNNLKKLFFISLAVKLNNIIYSLEKLEALSSLEYKENKLTLYQFGVANLKYILKTNRNNVI